MADIASMMRDEVVLPLRIEIGRMKLAARRPAPSNMSDTNFEDTDVVPDVSMYPLPELAQDDAQGHAMVARIKEELIAARAMGSQGNEQLDRIRVIDPFFVSVAGMFNLDCWNIDSEENKLVVHDLSVDEPKRTTGFIDKNVTMRGTTRPRLLGWEIKTISSVCFLGLQSCLHL